MGRSADNSGTGTGDVGSVVRSPDPNDAGGIFMADEPHYTGAHDPSIADLRAALEASRRAHMRLVQRAIAAGYPIPELAHDEDAGRNAVEQLIMVCARQGVDAPMVLQ